ncbi:hypothetical protein MMPV_007244 [Pyropia vietnamensis]
MDVAANTYAGSPLWRHNASRRNSEAVKAAAASPAARWALYDNDLRLLTAVPPPLAGANGEGVGVPAVPRVAWLPRALLDVVLSAVRVGGTKGSGSAGELDSPDLSVFLGEWIGYGAADGGGCRGGYDGDAPPPGLATGSANSPPASPPAGSLYCHAIRLSTVSAGARAFSPIAVEHLVAGMASASATTAFPPGTSFAWAHVRAAATAGRSPPLPPADVAVAAHGRSLFEFHARHAYCGTCGAPSVAEEGGSRRRCSVAVAAATAEAEVEAVTAGGEPSGGCGGVWFPRTDPVAIMLVVRRGGQEVLLGRQARFPADMWSALAGFMEHGEGIEDTVRREVMEEAGIRVGRVRLHSTQPWPFPYSLMIGCVAEALSDTITVDTKEMEDVRWFPREDVVAAVSGDPGASGGRLRVPPSMAIAHVLLRAYAMNSPVCVFGEPVAAPAAPAAAL